MRRRVEVRVLEAKAIPWELTVLWAARLIPPRPKLVLARAFYRPLRLSGQASPFVVVDDPAL